MKYKIPYTSWPLAAALLAAPLGVTFAQEEEDDDIFELTPFEVQADEEGYRATHTLAGTRIRTDLKDVGSSIQVVTEDFLKDTAATDNQSLLQYTTATEVSGVDGNFGGQGAGVAVNETSRFTNPDNSTRVRGLAAADNTRNFFLTQIPWDEYNVDRVDIQRGPNAILFGFGSPAGIINTGLIRPQYNDRYEVEFRIDNEGSFRGQFDLNEELMEGELALRVAGVKDDVEFRQDPAFEDDQRIFGAIKYEPSFLKSENARTVLEAHYESGDIEANRPRIITPQDRITPWFRPVRTVPGDLTSPFNPEGGIGKGTFTPEQLEDNVSEEPNRGQNRKTYASDGRPNPYYIPAIGNFGQAFGGPLGFIPDGNVGTLSGSFVSEFNAFMGLGPDGNVDRSVGGLPFARMGSVDNFANFAKDADLTFADFGQFKNEHIDDTSVFDFYNHLLDGPNKSEAQDWENYNVGISQTFFKNKLGFELVFDNQEYFQTQTSIITDGRQSIFIDINEELTDGTPNPNVGRPFITDSAQFGNNLQDTERESLRFTGFFEHNFEERGESWWRRLLGRQTITGLYSEEEVTTRGVGWQRFTMGQDFRDFIGEPNIRSNLNALNPVIYIGPNLSSLDSASGAGLTGAKAVMQIPDTTSVRYWDSTWVANDVDPADVWIDEDGGESTQSENPANYRGWTSREFSIQKADASNPNSLATSGSLESDEVDSQALVLQNYFWDGALVGTYGWRKDEADAFSTQAQNAPGSQRAQVEDMVLPDEPNQSVEAQTQSWSAVLHLNRMPWLRDRLPLDVSLYYNESENFQPAAGRVDLFGRSLAPPSGDTIDRSLFLGTKDGKYSLKVTRFTTAVTNATADRIQGDWFLGAVQAWGHNWMNIFELDNNNGAFGEPTGENTFAPLPGQTEAEAAAMEQAAIQGWKDHIQNLRGLSEELTGNPNAFDETYQIDRTITSKNGISATTPSNLSFTQDAVSEGYEFEFTANPVENWDIILNAAKVDATRQNVGGEALLRYVELVNHDLNNTPAGDLRLWWGSAGSPTFLQEWNSVFNANFNLTKLLEGTSAPELREWRYNLVTNYSFQDGVMKGVNIGGGYRWQDDVIIGFPPSFTDETQTDVTFDLDNPYVGPSESNVDLWVGYERDIMNDIRWRIQLNVKNVFGDKDLIPINAQPDGTPAAWRLGSTTSWMLTNRFTF